MQRRRFLGVAASALAGALGLAARGVSGTRLLRFVRVGNGRHPFARDRATFTTLGPTRPTAWLHFTLLRHARVSLEVIETGHGARSAQPVPDAQPPPSERAATLVAGPHRFSWTPPAGLPARTYILKLAVRSGGARETVSAVAGLLGVDAAFARRSALPGETVPLVVATDARRLTMQMLHSGPEREETLSSDEMKGVPVSEPRVIDWSAHTNGPAPIPVEVGLGWRSGVYAARLEADDGRVGFAPLIVRPLLRRSRLAVVLPTSTWAAYNFYDADGDGWGDTWYARWSTRHVDLTRPNLYRGVPHGYAAFDLPFQHWLARTGTVVDMYADEDIEEFSAQALREAYDLVAFPGHTEYATPALYRLLERYGQLGGNLAFLSANNFYRRVVRRHHLITLTGLWRDAGLPEAGLCGVQYVASDQGRWQRPFTVVGAHVAPWAFAGTGLGNGDTFGNYGIEFDSRSPASPPGTQVLANIPHLFGGGRTAEMTYYENASGARVFSAGALNFGAEIFGWPQAQTLFENVWYRLAS